MSELTNCQKGKRLYLFDNIKAILIFLVVLGHLLTNVVDAHPMFDAMYRFIYIFHMPVFVFITGYFSKNVEKCRENAVQKYLVPYVFFCVLLQIEARILNIGIGEEMAVRILFPQWGMWYLLAVFWWKLLIKDIIRFRLVIPVSIFLGLLSGFSREFSTYMGISRTISMLFFFLIGFYCNDKIVLKIRRCPKIFGIIGIALNVAFTHALITFFESKRHVLYMKSYYDEGLEVEQLLIRVGIYIAATAMIFACINLIGEKKNFLTRIGKNSVSIYIFHLFIIKLIERFYGFDQEPVTQLVIIIVIAMLITFIMSCNVINNLYQRVLRLVEQLIYRKENL